MTEPLDNSRSLQKLLPARIESGQANNEVRYYIDHVPAEAPGNGDALDLPSIVLRLRQLLLRHSDQLLSAEQAASHLGMSERTLRRRLAENGYSFRSIRQQTCMHAARRYLQSSSISIERIADLCGYSDQASFSRAFQKWGGESPDVVRRKAQRNPAGGDAPGAC